MKSIYQSLYHLILTSNGNKKFLTRVNQDILFNYMSSVIYNKYCHPIKIGGNANHVHIAVKMSPEVTISKLVKELQQNTTDFLRRERSVFPEFAGWDSGYIAISYHPSQQELLEEQLSDQFNYHRKVSFEEEIIELLEVVKTK